MKLNYCRFQLNVNDIEEFLHHLSSTDLESLKLGIVIRP